jgi:multidrug efflux pump subunit AcrA (membrane-fusion protein)
VQKGDLIVELSNPQLLQRLEETKWELKALEEEFKASQVDQASLIQQQESQVLNAVLDEERAQLEFDAHEELIATGAVSKLEYERRRVELQQSKQRLADIQKRLAKMKENLEAQKQARIARLNQTRNALERIQQQVDGLQVRASMDAIVLEVPLEPGQRIKMGANIAKLAEQDSLIAELQVPEIQIRDVSIGQKVMIDTRNSKIEGVVARVDPAVVRGNVQVDVHFQGELPSDARPDLSVDGEIKITEIADALYVGRPLFAQSQSNISLYKLSSDESIAERVEVKVGYGSVNQIQIVSGLDAGDKIITSDPTRFETYDNFRVN